MKEIVNVNIAGVAFGLDGNAYEILEKYLDTLRKRYAGTPEGKEVMEDIEARVAEIILTRQSSNETISIETVEIVIKQLGRPEDITDDCGQPEANVPKADKIPKRLYRNPDDSKIAGVCSGLGSYFDFDVNIIRLLFVLPLILMILSASTGGWGISWGGVWSTTVLLYIVLWVVIPKARTPLQKMEMKGEPLTASKIEKVFQEKFSKAEGNAANKPSAKSKKNASVFTEIITVLGQVILFFVKLIVAFIGIIISIVLVSVLVAVGLVLFNVPGIVGIPTNIPNGALVLMAILVVIPLGLLVFGLARAIFGGKAHRGFSSTLWVIWILTLVFGTVIIFKDFSKYSDIFKGQWYFDEKIEQMVDEFDDNALESEHKLTLLRNTLYIEPMDTAAVDMDNIKEFPVKIRVMTEGDDTVSKLEIKRYYKGIERDKKKGTVKDIKVDYRVSGDTLFVRPYIQEVDGVSGERVEFNVMLPARVHYVVGAGVGYNEYIED